MKPEGMLHRSRGEVLADTLAEKTRLEFEGTHWEIVREVHLKADERFQTKFGHYGRNGYHIRNTETGEEQVVGWTLLRKIATLYNAVELPYKRKRRTNLEIAEDKLRRSLLGLN